MTIWRAPDETGVSSTASVDVKSKDGKIVGPALMPETDDDTRLHNFCGFAGHDTLIFPVPLESEKKRQTEKLITEIIRLIYP